jgi:ssDNA-binding Zn-finger/Zn-ribbon topoisomerase 1
MKKPHYFCDFCGKEVPGQAKLCPFCGHFFTSVRCPRCGFTSSAAKFRYGCPACGYSSPEQDREAQAAAPRSGRKRADAPGPLPVWVFLLVAILLIFSLGGLIMLFYS